jgi:hypothetical protein
VPIHLDAPQGHAHGPDGKGWNRLSLGGHMGTPLAQCALLPTSYPALRESQDTRRARWGGFNACTNGGQCDTCPVFQAAPSELRSLDDRVLVRIHPHDGRLYLMNRPEDGWASGALRWTWAHVARLNGWEIGRRHQDEHSDGFWLERA